jgi:hypothetical protein
LEKTLKAVNDTRAKQKIEINKLNDDNQKLIKLNQENEKTIKILENEKFYLVSKNEERNFELKNTFEKLKLKEENLLYTIRQLEDFKLANIKCQNTLKDYEITLDKLRNENSNLNHLLQKEKNSRNKSEKNVERYKILIQIVIRKFKG